MSNTLKTIGTIASLLYLALVYQICLKTMQGSDRLFFTITFFLSVGYVTGASKLIDSYFEQPQSESQVCFDIWKKYPWANYITIDESGYMYCHKETPTKQGNEWKSSGRIRFVADTGLLHSDWQSRIARRGEMPAWLFLTITTPEP